MGLRFDLLSLFTTLALLSTTTTTVLSDVILSKVDRRVSSHFPRDLISSIVVFPVSKLCGCDLSFLAD
jgi:hypothetical protein